MDKLVESKIERKVDTKEDIDNLCNDLIDEICKKVCVTCYTCKDVISTIDLDKKTKTFKHTSYCINCLEKFLDKK